MRHFLLDTGPLGDHLNKRRGVHIRVRTESARGNRVGICPPVLAEFVYGIENSATRDFNMDVLRIGLPALRVWPFDIRAAYEYGRLAAELRRIGRPMQPIDIMVAAVALTLGSCTVVTKDSDLSAIPGLRVENWSS